MSSVHIDAPPEIVWEFIVNPKDIEPDELGDGLAYKIGTPYPEEAFTELTDEGRIRHVRWAKGVTFDEVITDWEENRYVRWTYQFRPESFPPGALDDHVVIGGKYFDLIDTSYQLTPDEQGTTLTLRVKYRVSTNFNWYSGPLSKLLVDDTAKTLLNFYKARSEDAQAHIAMN
ncbi:SRPBCC family protein [Hahella sp. CCB-MM4]|uniref:SRPBCC family protein n=1 Tax=Hahella sp. (strain CCB-MM4) TaxID=1926491 RepID=UPI001AEF432B|nr:SRPBCC family protein [Hahella sp. CCB-MM4]